MNNKAMEDWIKSISPSEERMNNPLIQKAMEAAKEAVGFPGRMMAGSKSGYSLSHKANVPVFNANLCTKEHGKIWHGDLDLTLDEGLVKALAQKLNTTVYVLRERSARFDKENSPEFEESIIEVSPTETKFNDKNYDTQSMTRATKGRLSGKIVYKPEFRRK